MSAISVRPLRVSRRAGAMSRVICGANIYPVLSPVALALLTLGSHSVWAHHDEDTQVKELGVITVTSGQPTSLPTQIPTTMEGVDKTQIEQTINATDSEDALKYFPSLLVRKRYIGDYNHAVLSSRASGTGNSARSAVYADGILLSNYLGNGASYTPRWGMVSPEEIERVDVMYGPFSAAYPGNSIGAVVDYVTRMPTQAEGHIKVSGSTQKFDLYNTHETYNAWQTSASVGDRKGGWTWWVDVNHTDSKGQPLSLATKPVSVAAPAGTAVSGAVFANDRTNTPWVILGTTTQYHTVQDHAKIKLAYDISPDVRASYVLGYWQNDARGRPQTYLHDAAGNPIYSGTVNINGNAYALTGSGGLPLFNMTNDSIMHVMHGLSIKSHSKSEWDWEVAGSLYDYAKDQSRTSTNPVPVAQTGGAGRITDQNGTGWNNLSLKGIWRPQGANGAHQVDFGYQVENYKLHILTSAIAGNWMTDSAGAMVSDVGGKSRLQSLYAQDAWAFAKDWKTVLGLRAEQWQATDGYTRNNTPSSLNYASRKENYLSPKAALSWQWQPDTVLKVSTGRAVRMPTVSELYGATTGTLSFVNDPNLKPEKAWTTEFSAERELDNGLLRVTLFHENVRDALYSQFNAAASTNTVQNVDRIRTRGVEVAFQLSDVYARGLDLSGSLTYADSKMLANSGYVTTPGDTIGKQQPRVPVWRATMLANYRFNEQLSAALGARYSGKQFSTLNNSDVNGFAYTAASRFFTVDFRLRYQVSKQVSAAFGIDNLNNYKYWNFHPYPQRTYTAELKWDL